MPYALITRILIVIAFCTLGYGLVAAFVLITGIIPPIMVQIVAMLLFGNISANIFYLKAGLPTT